MMQMKLSGRVKKIIPIFESKELYSVDILPDTPSLKTNTACVEFLRLLKVDVDEDRVMNRTPRQALATLQSFQGNTLDSFRDDTESFVQWNMFLKLAVELMKPIKEAHATTLLPTVSSNAGMIIIVCVRASVVLVLFVFRVS